MYREYTVMQPLQRSYAITIERINNMVASGALNSLYDAAKVAKLENAEELLLLKTVLRCFRVEHLPARVKSDAGCLIKTLLKLLSLCQPTFSITQVLQHTYGYFLKTNVKNVRVKFSL